MARAYLTEKQMPKDYWFHAIHHAARMHNQIPAAFNGKLTTPFELVHRVAPDSRTWFPLFSIVYFYKETDTDKDREMSKKWVEPGMVPTNVMYKFGRPVEVKPKDFEQIRDKYHHRRECH